jgi:quaternary ammonium compound-resistance protein SugE
MAWVYLLSAGFLEIGFALCLKESHGFSRAWPSLGVLVFGGLSFLLLSLALRTLPISSAYAIWTGIGAAGTALVSVVLLGESGSLVKLLAIAAIIGGVVGLRLTGSE